jgi:hypothetical protein
MTKDEQEGRRTEKDLIRAFADLFDQVKTTTPEEIDETLRSAGYDPDEVAGRFAAVAKQALEQSPMNWRNRDDQLEAERARLQQRSRNTRSADDREGIIWKIKQIIGSTGRQQRPAYARFRNFEEASNEDLASWLAELEYLASKEEIDDNAEE